MAEGEGKIAGTAGKYVVAKVVKPFVHEAEEVSEKVAADVARAAEHGGPKPGWTARLADNGKGTVVQRPGASGNADMFRYMDPTDEYPNGYVRFYNSGGQPIDVDGKPTGRTATHIARNPDGSYPTPKGW